MTSKHFQKTKDLISRLNNSALEYRYSMAFCACDVVYKEDMPIGAVQGLRVNGSASMQVRRACAMGVQHVRGEWEVSQWIPRLSFQALIGANI